MLNSAEFTRLVQVIIAHGDLTDVAFMEKTLGAKFRSQYNQTAAGLPNPESVIYQTDQVRGTPIHVDLYVDYDHGQQIALDSIGFMRIESQAWPSPDAAFIRDCLHISAADFSSRFGGGFLEALATDGAPIIAASKELDQPGKGASKLYLSYSYNRDDKLVADVEIGQRP